MILSKLFLYLMRSYLERFLVVLSVATTALLLSNIFDTLNRFRSANLSLSSFLNIIFLKLPYLAVEIMPMIGFISALLFLHHLKRTNQLVAIWSTGTSIWHIIFPVLVTSLLIGFIATSLLQPFSAILVSKYDTMEAKLLKKSSSQAILSSVGVMIAEDYQNQRRVIIARSVDQDKSELNDVTILFIDDNNNFISRLDAPKAYLKKNKFILYDVKVFDNTMEASAAEVQKSIEFNTNVSIDRFIRGFVSPEHISFWELPGLIIKLRDAGIPISRYQIYYYKQLLKPLMMMTVSLLSFCFINGRYSRMSNWGSFGIGIFVSFVVYLMSEICLVLLLQHGLSIMLASLCPMCVVILLSIFTILHLHETG